MFRRSSCSASNPKSILCHHPKEKQPPPDLDLDSLTHSRLILGPFGGVSMVRDRLSFPLLPPCRLPWPIYLINWTYKKKRPRPIPVFSCLFVCKHPFRPFSLNGPDARREYFPLAHLRSLSSACCFLGLHVLLPHWYCLIFFVIFFGRSPTETRASPQ